MPHLPQTVTTVTPAWDLPAINETLALATPETIVRWALAQGVRQLTSTSFGPHAAATLHWYTALIPIHKPFGWIPVSPANRPGSLPAG